MQKKRPRLRKKRDLLKRHELPEKLRRHALRKRCASPKKRRRQRKKRDMLKRHALPKKRLRQRKKRDVLKRRTLPNILAITLHNPLSLGESSLSEKNCATVSEAIYSQAEPKAN